MYIYQSIPPVTMVTMHAVPQVSMITPPVTLDTGGEKAKVEGLKNVGEIFSLMIIIIEGIVYFNGVCFISCSGVF